MIKGSFIIIMTFGFALNAKTVSDVDPNLAFRPNIVHGPSLDAKDRRHLTESGLSCPGGDCGPTVILEDPAPQVRDLAPGLKRILESHNLKNLPTEDVQTIEKELEEEENLQGRLKEMNAQLNAGNRKSTAESQTIQQRLKSKMESSTGGFSGKIRRKSLHINYKKEFN